MPCPRELFYVFFIALYIWTYIVRHWRTTHSRRHSSSSTVSLLHIQTLLSPSGATISRLLLERSQANVRLERTLGLTNTFVSSDPIVHRKFVQRSSGLLKGVQANGWAKFQDICCQAVDSTLLDWCEFTEASKRTSIQFDHFIQIVVLRLVLVGLLDVGREVEDISFSSLALVTSLINDLWTHSKSGLPPPPDLTQQLHEHLRLLVPIDAGFDNPIDLVVPTWETMWRVCATTIARAQESQEYKTLFHDLLHTDSSTAQQLVSVGSRGFTARDFISEVMRLHPPVKHISRVQTAQLRDCFWTTSSAIFRRSWEAVRQCRMEFRTQSADCDVADIGEILRLPSIWNRDAQAFKPERHRSASPDMKGAQKLIFGHGPLRCVAASWAPDAAAIISATIMDGCERSGWMVTRGDKIGGRMGWDGWMLMKEE